MKKKGTKGGLQAGVSFGLSADQAALQKSGGKSETDGVNDSDKKLTDAEMQE